MTQIDYSAADIPLPPLQQRHIVRIVLGVFILTFIASRVLVIAIQAQLVPDLFFHVGQTHVHHLNYGIFLLSSVGAYLLFRQPSQRNLEWAAIVYGAGLALTFDEFGMWLHLGGSYWNRQSFDAIVVITAVLFLIAYAPSLNKFRREHWIWTIIVGGIVVTFLTLLATTIDSIASRLAPLLKAIESAGPK